MSRPPITDSELEQWAKVRADDAGHLARELVAHRKASGKAEFIGLRCTGCGSSITDKELAAERSRRPSLISCCPERSMVASYEVKCDPALSHVARVIEESGGWWHPCSGCYDTEDGHPTAPYPRSPALRCDVGSGCHECGGLGAVWEYYSDKQLAEMQKDGAAA